jgi:putative ABC transport system permease protein
MVLFVQDELSYDNFHQKADRIALFKQYEAGLGSGGGFTPLLKSEIGQVEQVTRLVKHRPLVAVEGKAYYENEFYFADSTFFQLFDFQLLQGNPQTALSGVENVIISEKIAQKYFGNENPIGKVLKCDNKFDLTVVGLLKNVPTNSHIDIDFLCSFQKSEAMLGQKLDSYWDYKSLTYVLFSENTDLQAVSAKLESVRAKTQDQNSSVWKLGFVPLREIYLKAPLDDRTKAAKAIENVYIFSAVAFFVLLLACFNYINLSSARSTLRGKEVGVRKVLGAKRQQIFWQFMVESAIFTFGGTLLALLIAYFALPFLNQFVEKQLSFASFFSTVYFIFFVGIILLITLFTGTYPSLLLSSFHATEVLKNKLFRGANNTFFRQSLVVLQFALSIAILVSTLLILNQLYFIQNKNLGYDRSQVMTLTLQGEASPTQKETLKRQIQGLSFVQSVTLSALFAGEVMFQNKLVESYVPKGKDLSYGFNMIDTDFLKTMNIKLIEGKNFTETQKPEQNLFIINQSMVDFLAWENGALGKEIGYYSYQYTPEGGYKEVPIRGQVVGVVADYHQSSLKTKIMPMLLQLNSGNENKLSIKIEKGKAQEAVSEVEQIWKANFPDRPIEYSFLDKNFDANFKKETMTAKVLGLFSSLTIFISCLGLFGLVSFSAERRIKEIGIRKVLGASVLQITTLLSKDFLKLVMVAFVIASPIAYYFMDKWLADFAYRITISWWIFAVAGVSVVLIALITVSWQSIKAAVANPVKSLRSE